jgi:two-component system, chemotaxis family, response regulator Rcp1
MLGIAAGGVWIQAAVADAEPRKHAKAASLVVAALMTRHSGRFASSAQKIRRLYSGSGRQFTKLVPSRRYTLCLVVAKTLMTRQILLIEDNPGDVRLMREALRGFPEGAELKVVSDGAQALRYLRREQEFADAVRPCLIFMDLNLPMVDARDLLRQLKADQEIRGIPVAVLTTSDAERDIREVYELHANCYLRKPADLQSYLDTVRQAVHFWLAVALLPGE